MRIWVPKSAAQYGYLDLGLNFKQYFFKERLLLDFGVGLGLSKSAVSINIYDEERKLYDVNITRRPFYLEAKVLFDDSYETRFDQGSIISNHKYLSARIHYKITHSGYIGLSMRYHATTSDYYDAIKYRTIGGATNNSDNISTIAITYSHVIGRGDK